MIAKNISLEKDMVVLRPLYLMKHYIFAEDGSKYSHEDGDSGLMKVLDFFEFDKVGKDNIDS